MFNTLSINARQSQRSCSTRALPLLLCMSPVFGIHVLGQTIPARPSASSMDLTKGPAPTGSVSRASHRAEVTYRGDLLTVVASNSSLNQVLREIARQTGMKITGGVAEDRVFGVYGPASPSAVLATLLDGTGSNLLIVQNALHTPTELILTPRIGGITPPNPNATGFDDVDNADVAVPAQSPTTNPSAPTQFNSRAPNRSGTGGIDTNPAATAPSSTSQQLAFPSVDSGTPPSTATTTPTTPDPTSDTKTPQQIFEQLQKLRQQSQQQPKTQ